MTMITMCLDDERGKDPESDFVGLYTTADHKLGQFQPPGVSFVFFLTPNSLTCEPT